MKFTSQQMQIRVMGGASARRLQSCCEMADMDFVERVAALNVLWKAEKRCRLVRCCVWVHQILQSLGEFHHLFQELHLDDGRFQRYFRLCRSQFDDLLSHIGGRISLQDTNYRRSIPPAERLSVCLRSVNHLIFCVITSN